MKTLKRCIGTCRSSFASPWFVWASLTLFVAPVWADTGPSVLGGLKRELYTNVPGLSVAELTNHAKFPNSPDLVDIASSFETPNQQGDNYGERLTGYIIPPVTGAYVFYLASDDQGILFLSPDEDPAKKQPIAWESEWNMPRQWSTPQPPHQPVTSISPPIQLEAGRRYYVEALHKEGGGGDNFGVAWQTPGAPVPETGSPPISGEFLATPGTNEPPSVAMLSPAEGSVFGAGTNLFLKATAADTDNGVKVVIFRANGTALGMLRGPTQTGTYSLIWSNVPAGEFALTAEAIDFMGASTTSAPVHIKISSTSLEQELHLVGVYSGNVDGHSSRTNEEGVAKVTVNRPGKRVTLLLGAYEPVLWSLTVSPETLIEKVILTGYYPKRIEGLAPGVPVIAAWSGEGGSGPYLSFGYSIQSCEFYRALPKVIAMTAMSVSSFHGAYTAPVEAFVIDAVQDDPRLSPDYPPPADVAELPSLEFQVAFYTGSSPGSTGEIYRKSYTLAGTVGGGSLLPDLRVVPDSSQRYFYAARWHEVMRIDAQTGYAEGMQVTAGEVSWPMGVAYDSLRDRVLLVTLGGEGFLYAYYPQSGQWSLVRSMNNLDVGNLVYHAAQDALYAVGQNWGNYGPWRIYRLTPDGVQQGEIALPQVCLTGAEYGITSELVSVGEYLVLLVGAENRSYYSDPAETRMYLIDPRSGQVWLTSRQRELNQCPTIEITSPTQNSIFAVGKPIAITARANDAEHHIQTVDFYANGEKLGQIRGNSISYSFQWSNAPIGTYSLRTVALDSSWCSVTSVPVHISVTQGNTAPVVTCPPPQSVTATTETGLATYITLNASVSDPDYGPLQAVWYVDGNPVATNNLPTDPSHPRIAVYSGIFMLGLHSVKVVVSDFIAPPTFCTTTVEVTSPVAKIFPARDDQQSPRAASDGTNFFVVWLDRRNKPHGDWTACDVYGARVTSGGYVLDRNGILIAPGSMWASPPAVGFDGTNYLVVWQDNRNSEMGAIRGTRVSRAGVVLDGPNGFRIGEDTGLLQSNPSLAFDGRLWFVAWNDWRNQTNGIPDNLICDIYGARITPNGEVLDAVNVPVVRAPWWQTCPAVGSLGRDFLVIWQDMDGLRGARVADSGAVSAPFVVSHGRVGSIGQPALGRLGTNYLAAWDESFNNGNNVVYSWVVGTRLTQAGTPLDGDGFLIRTNQTRSTGVAVAGLQSQAIVAWQESAFEGTDSRVWGAHVTPAGMVYFSNTLTKYVSAQTQPTVAGNNRAALFAAWHDMRNATNAYVNWPWGDVYGTVIDLAWKLDPPLIVPVDFLISSETLNPPIVRWANPAPITYGTLLGPAQLNATSSVPGTFVYSPPAGTLLHAGLAQRLSVVFTPLDLTRHVRMTNTVRIDVLPASLTIRADDKARYAGTPNPPLTATYSGFVGNDSPSVLDTPLTLTTTAATDSPPGEYPIIASGAADADYLIGFGNGVLLVKPVNTGPGSLDLTIQTQFESWLMIHDLAKQPDGKILVAGWFRTAGDIVRTNLARLNPDGSVDATFNAGGLTIYEVFSAVLQPDGKILIGMPQAPSLFDGFSSLGLLRLNPDGSLDQTFRPGVSEDDSGGIRSIALQPDGKIVVGGMFSIGSRNVLARLNSDGSVDNTFDAGGIYVWEGDDYVVRDLFIQPDGKVLVRGDIDQVQEVNVNGCFRLLPNGELDPDFLIPKMPSTALGLQRDGKILIGRSSNLDRAAGLYRLNPDGTRDETFAQGPAWLVPTAITIQPDGKIVFAGYPEISVTDPANIFVSIPVVRVESNGTLDSTFDSGFGANDMVNDLLLLPHHVLVGGMFTMFDGVPRQGLAWLHNEVPVPDSFVKRTISGLSVQLAVSPPAGTLVWAVEEMPPANWAVLDISNDGVWAKTTGKVKFGPFFDANPRTLSYRVLPPLGFVGIGLFSGQASADGKSTPVIGDERIVIPTQHPADRTPSDWKLTMNEATGYAAAWRSGENWPIPPNPIPVDYATRASALWRGGEAYKLDPSIEGPPLWWVNTDAVPLRQGGDPQPFGAVRHVPPAFVPGEPLNCAIEVATRPMCRAYAVEEKVPAGWQVRSPSDGGQMDTVNGFVKWGPFYDAAPRTLRYTLVPPLTAKSSVELVGTASFDGFPANTTGCDQLQPGSKLTWGQREGQHGWTLQLKGPIGARYVVERSADLTSWTSVMTVTNQLGTIELPDVQPTVGNCYFRGRAVADN